MKQYEDYDFHNPGGESLNQVRTRIENGGGFIVCQMEEGETALSWFLMQQQSVHICFSYCEIEVKGSR